MGTTRRNSLRFEWHLATSSGWFSCSVRLYACRPLSDPFVTHPYRTPAANTEHFTGLRATSAQRLSVGDTQFTERHVLTVMTCQVRTSTSPTILVVDDDADTRQLCRTLLEQHAFHVVEAADGETALRVALACRPDVVLLYLWLPVLDGFVVADRLRRDPRTSRTAIVVVSGALMNHEPERARLLGCDDFIAKPCPPAVLIAAVRAAVEGRAFRKSPDRRLPSSSE